MKRKAVAFALATIVGATVLAGCGGNSASKSQGGTFTPGKSIDWYCTSSPGGGSDVFSRQISDIMIAENMVNNQAIVVTNKTDGSGEVGRNEVANTKGNKADYTLLTFNSGDLMPMVKNTKNRAENFTILAIMAVDKQLIYKGKGTNYQDFKSAIEAAKNGKQVVIGGSKGDDVATYEAMIAEIGVTKNQMNYITYDSTGDAITAILGGHVDFVISKPAAASEYVESGDLTPVLALSKERYSGNLAEAPKLSEIGDYADVEVPIWRGVAAPAAMSQEARAYWSEQLKKVSETEAWQKDYIAKYMLISDYMDTEAATMYVKQYESDYLAAIAN